MNRPGLFTPHFHGKSGLYVAGGGGGIVVADYSTPLTPVALPADGTWWSFIGSDGANAAATTANINEMAQKRKLVIPGVPDWDDGDPNSMQNEWNFEGGKYSTWPGHLEFAPGGLYKSLGESWALAANGDLTTPGDGGWDARWVTAFSKHTTFVHNSNRTSAYSLMRPFHEPNGDWNNGHWSVQTGEEAHFQAAFTRVRTLQLAHAPWITLGMSFNGETSTATPPNIGAMIRKDSNGHALDFDYLSVDLYNAAIRRGTTAADFDAQANITKVVNGETQPASFESWRLLALSLNVPLVISEWSNDASLGEAPGWLDGYHAWLKLHGGYGPGKVWVEALFNVPGYGSTSAPWNNYMFWDTATKTISANQPLTAQHYFDIWGL